MPECTFTRTPSAIKIERLLKLIAECPLTVPEIAVALSISKGHATEYVERLHAAKRIHIAKWSRDPVCGMKPWLRALYQAGSGRDAKKPPAITKAQASKRRYAKIKADPVLYTAMVINCRERYRRSVFKAKPDPLVEAFFKKAA